MKNVDNHNIEMRLFLERATTYELMECCPVEFTLYLKKMKDPTSAIPVLTEENWLLLQQRLEESSLILDEILNHEKKRYPPIELIFQSLQTAVAMHITFLKLFNKDRKAGSFDNPTT